LGIAQITTGEAALRVARRLAEEILESGDDPLKHLRDFQSLWTRAKYAKEIRTLGTLYDDVWIAESAGQSEAKIRKWVTGTLREFANRRKAL
jgi:hypothetical protein